MVALSRCNMETQSDVSAQADAAAGPQSTRMCSREAMFVDKKLKPYLWQLRKPDDTPLFESRVLTEQWPPLFSPVRNYPAGQKKHSAQGDSAGLPSWAKAALRSVHFAGIPKRNTYEIFTGSLMFGSLKPIGFICFEHRTEKNSINELVISVDCNTDKDNEAVRLLAQQFPTLTGLAHWVRQEGSGLRHEHRISQGESQCNALVLQGIFTSAGAVTHVLLSSCTSCHRRRMDPLATRPYSDSARAPQTQGQSASSACSHRSPL